MHRVSNKVLSKISKSQGARHQRKKKKFYLFSSDQRKKDMFVKVSSSTGVR